MIRGGQAYCWGDNTYGELGNGSTISSDVPAAVYTGGVLSGVTLTSITAGNVFTCALSSAGAAYCWGSNNLGQLGNNSQVNSNVPVAVNTSGVLSGVTLSQVSAGQASLCALSSVGAAYCWGSGGLGQLGNRGSFSYSVPVAVYTGGVLSGVTLSQISAGGIGACVLSNAGAAYCWGYGNYGQLGNGTFNNVSAPVAVTASGVLSGVTLSQIAVGFQHVCALSAAGTAYCWGYDADGELGNNATANSNVPVAVSTSGALAGQTLSSIEAGNYYTCVLSSTGAGYCWGYGNSGQLGNNATSSSSVPVAVTATGVLSGATLSQLSAGQNSTCALDSPGTAYCWGSNSSGQAGSTTTAPATAFDNPVVVSPSQASTLGTGYVHACDIRAGKAYCWGDNGDGELGNNSTTSSSVPVAVYTGGVLSGVTLTQIVSGQYFSCAMSNAGTVYCWGQDTSGELGNNSTTNSSVPVAVYTSGALSGQTLTQLDGGYLQTCVLSSTSAAYCWGYNTDGELGDGNTTSSSVPVAVTVSSALTGKVLAALYPGDAHSCATDTAGNAFCWGSNGNGALGNNSTGSSNVAVAVSTGGALSASTYVAAMSSDGGGGDASDETTCALSSTGAAYCWGDNNSGQLGNNSNAANSLVPVAVSTSGALSGVSLAQITAGGDYACGLSTAGAAYCWGSNGNDQLGINNTSTTSSNVPLAVYTGGALSGLTLLQISGSPLWSVCVSDTTGAVYCWGTNTSGQLGNNATASSDAAVQVVNLAPGAPTSVTAFPANGSASVYWVPPSSFGTSGSATGYTVTASPGGATCTSSSSALTCTLAGLSNSTPYTVTVVTNTTGGPSYASAAATVTPWPPANQISAGWTHACLLSGGKAYCWGDNTYGQLGNNSTTSTTSPVPVYTGGVLSGVTLTQIGSGQYYTCALSSAGNVYCWGYNGYGQLGNNTTTNSAVPVAVTTAGTPMSGATIRQLAVAQISVCALSAARAAYCWGGNGNGNLGNFSTTSSSVPVAVNMGGVPSGVTFVTMSGAGSDICALGTDANAYCWGFDSHGQLGGGVTGSNGLEPGAVTTSGVLSGIALASITVGYDHACAVSSTGGTYCWGLNSLGELGNNSTTDSSVPVAVYTGGPLFFVRVTQVTGGYDHTCALGSGSVGFCWGDDGNGELGNNSATSSDVPVSVTTSGTPLSGVGIAQISGGQDFTCALSGAGTAYCWGNDGTGQLGNGPGGQSLTPGYVGPQAPTSVTATPGNTTVAVSWTAPVFLNNGSLSSYTVSASPGGATCTATTAAGCTLTGLTDGTTYTITVTATATTGTSGPSLPASGAPTGLELTPPQLADLERHRQRAQPVGRGQRGRRPAAHRQRLHRKRRGLEYHDVGDHGHRRLPYAAQRQRPGRQRQRHLAHRRPPERRLRQLLHPADRHDGLPRSHHHRGDLTIGLHDL
jgi:alpha-tubulin suppressor-like RCC1 family protein